MDNAKARDHQPEVYHSVHRGLCGAAADKVCREKIEVYVPERFCFDRLIDISLKTKPLWSWMQPRALHYLRYNRLPLYRHDVNAGHTLN